MLQEGEGEGMVVEKVKLWGAAGVAVSGGQNEGLLGLDGHDLVKF